MKTKEIKIYKFKEAFEALADVYRKILETELDYQNSAEYFEEHADANEYEFT